ncbi:MAG: PorV/PorQ family protein [Candidatus Marinimicrobia bacterium]|nr:PorV/PorQ family protein [Candidatus Neomarinimicrobiota bacterium]MCK9483420.1 PorV/PorQ family protein [Candidatus Neomarinimicrobiota bacterium]MCK9559493.1 PorV/PorQ family protein [Candidatus Neomarinimicrobiota bacterium]MDD5061610.1 PorV/PorQ family protein [Candidatus Neomarinimicrobiota bacterium]MDD5230545.1 PorV/PorQ family protein [Candidatus Neomarinimicrobiota bacterium]
MKIIEFSDTIRFAKRKYISLLVLILLSMPSANYAKTVSKVGTTAASFLKIGVGGRALGMGEAYTTLANDATATFWNPAGLATINRTQILLNHYDYIADLSFDYGSVAIPFQSFGTIAMHMTYLGMPDLERTTITEPYGTGEMVSASSMAVGLSYARSLTDRFSIGGSVNYIRESIWHCASSGVSMDIGVLYRTFFKNLMIGMSISNFGTSMQLSGSDLLIQHDVDTRSNGNNGNINGNLATDKFNLPILFRVGISANLARDFLHLKNSDFTLAINAVHPSDNYEYLNVGSEYVLRDLIAVRAGYRQLLLEEAEGGLTFGLGLRLNLMGYKFIVDYAAVDFGRLDYLNKYSLILAF